MRYWLFGRVPDLQLGGCRFESWPGLLCTKIYSAFHPSGVGKWVPAAAGKAKAGMAHSDCGWTYGCAGKTEIPWEHAPYLSASAVVVEALYQVYAPLPLTGMWKNSTLMIPFDTVVWATERQPDCYMVAVIWLELSLHFFQFWLTPPPSPPSLAAIKFRMVWCLGTSLPTLSRNTGC